MANPDRTLDHSVDQAQQSIRAGKHAASQALDRIVDGTAALRDRAEPALDRLAERASMTARQSAEWLRDNGGRVRDQVTRASDRTVGYVRQEPVRAVMMAAAAGIAIYALARLFRSDANSFDRKWR